MPLAQNTSGPQSEGPRAETFDEIPDFVVKLVFSWRMKDQGEETRYFCAYTSWKQAAAVMKGMGIPQQPLRGGAALRGLRLITTDYTT